MAEFLQVDDKTGKRLQTTSQIIDTDLLQSLQRNLPTKYRAHVSEKSLLVPWSTDVCLPVRSHIVSCRIGCYCTACTCTAQILVRFTLNAEGRKIRCWRWRQGGARFLVRRERDRCCHTRRLLTRAWTCRSVCIRRMAAGTCVLWHGGDVFVAQPPSSFWEVHVER